MEFLMTYGWALLVVLIAIGALAFFGVLNPGKFLPSQCILGPGLACEDFKVDSANNYIILKIINGMGENFDLFLVHIDKKSVESKEVCGGELGYIAFPGLIQQFNDGEVKLVTDSPSSGGIACIIQGTRPFNCCVNYNALIGGISPGTTVCPGVENYCDASASLPLRGEKFNEALIVTYRVLGSQIVHKRVGKLTAQVE